MPITQLPLSSTQTQTHYREQDEAYEGWDKRDKNANRGNHESRKHRTETSNIKTMGRTKLMEAREIDLLYMSVWAWGWPQARKAIGPEQWEEVQKSRINSPFSSDDSLPAHESVADGIWPKDTRPVMQMHTLSRPAYPRKRGKYSNRK